MISMGLQGSAGDPNRIFGVVVGIVTDNEDPEGLGRVKVMIPRITGDDESNWARVCSFMAGNERGGFFLPEVDDEVLLAFEHGDVNTPYVIGALWNGKDKAPQDNGDGANNFREIVSRAGHKFTFDDTDDKGAVKIETTAGHSVVLSDVDENMVITEMNGNTMELTADGTVITDANGNTVEMTSDGMVLTDANGNTVEMASSGMTLADANGNEIKMGSSGVDVNGKLTVSA